MSREGALSMSCGFVALLFAGACVILDVELLRWISVGCGVIALLILWFGRKLPWGGYLSSGEVERIVREVVARTGSPEEGKEVVSEAVEEYRIKIRPSSKHGVTSVTDFVREIERASGGVADVLDQLEKSDLLKIWKNLNQPFEPGRPSPRPPADPPPTTAE